MNRLIASIYNVVTNNIDKAYSLNDKIDLINQNVQFNITFMWAMLAVTVATVGVALNAIAKLQVNRRVEEELPKAILSNPPVFYYKGRLGQAWESYSEEIKYNSMGIISIDCKKLNITNLDFPIELRLFHIKQEQVSVMDFSKSEHVKKLKI